MLRHPIHTPRLKSVAVPFDTEPLYLDGVFLMKNRFFEYKAVLAMFAIAVPFSVLAWLFVVPQRVSPVTFVAIVLVAMGAALVGVNSWRNGQATRHIGHVINDTEKRS
jgi:hypothetical protein